MTHLRLGLRLGLAAPILFLVLLASCSKSATQTQCSPQSCGGCCDSKGICQPGTAAAACGLSGGACQTCSAGTACSAGACPGGSSDAGTGAGGRADDGGGADHPVDAPGGTGGSGGASGDAGGIDSGPSCPTGRRLCAGECVDFTSDPRNCGGCGQPCGTNQVCNASTCTTPPDCRTQACPGLSYCDLSTGLCNTGCAFDTQCGTDETCDVTSHACGCKTAYHRCSGVCLSDTSIASCGTSCTPCPTDPNATTTCSSGGSCTLTCATGYKSCGGVCALCPTAGATVTACSGSQCVATTCSTSYHLCSGQCAANASVMSCGTSCTPCPTSVNGVASCNGTACALTCNTGARLCANACAVCPTTNVSVSACSDSACVATSCVTGYHVCAGACASSSSVMSCGSSCTPCPTAANGVATCSGSTCSLTCSTGYRLCSNACALCPTTAATTSCSGTQCVAASCATGSHVCSGACVLSSSPQTCGSSCTPCAAPPSNGSATCNGTTCGVACNGGYINCSGACCVDCNATPTACSGTDWCPPLTHYCQSVQKLQPDAADATAYDNFASSVGISGPLAVVGTPADDGSAGTAYLFAQQANGVWTQQGSKLRPDTAANVLAQFGAAVAASGQRLLVGAPAASSSTGAAFLFDGTGGVFGPGATMKWTGEKAGDGFGKGVALSGDRAIVGAVGAAVGGLQSAGAAYIFERQPDMSWPATGIKLVPNDPQTLGFFGLEVGLDGDFAIVGSSYIGAYIFARQADGTWVQEQKLQDSVSTTNDAFGASVALSGSRALVGATNNNDRGASAGAVFVFERQTSGVWMQTAELLAPGPNAGPGDQFGISVALDGDHAVVGTPSENRSPTTTGTTGVGSAYVFHYQAAGGTWETGAELLTAKSDEITGRALGNAVSLSWPYALIGAVGDTIPGPPAVAKVGSAYVFNAQSVSQ